MPPRFALCLLLAVPLLSAQAASPSFNCAKAKSWSEKTICSDDTLAKLDQEMADVYKQALDAQLDADERKNMLAEQRGFIKGRDDCAKAKTTNAVTPLDCLRDVYRIRISELNERLGVDDESASAASATGGSALDDCYAQVDSRPEVGLCLEEKLDQVTVALDEAVTAMTAQMRSLDEEVQLPVSAAQSFEESQDAFFKFRDASCGWHAASMGSGTGANDEYMGCLVDLSRARAAEIGRLLITQ